MATEQIAAERVRSLARGTRIRSCQTNGTIVPGVIHGPAFGDDFYCASLAYPEGVRFVCVHRSDVVIEPVFASLRAAAVALQQSIGGSVEAPTAAQGEAA